MLPSKGFLMLSKPVEKTTHVSLVPYFTPGPSSGVRVSVCYYNSRVFFFLLICSFFLLFGYPPFESFAMSLEDSDDLNIPDAAPIDPVLEAGALPKFDMHRYRSSRNESHVRYRVKLYGIPEELHPRVIPEGMTMDALPPGAIDPFPRPGEYNALDVAKLREHAGRAFSIKDSEGKVITMVEFLRLPNFKGCKVAAGTLLPPSALRKVVDDKEKKKRKVEEKAATKASAVNVQAEAAVDKPIKREGPRKKRRAKPLEALANEEHASPLLSVGWMDTLQDQTDEHAISPRFSMLANQFLTKMGGGRRRDILKDPAPENIVPDAEASYSTGRFGNLPFTPQWGLTDSSRIDNLRECRDMMANLFTPTDEEFFNDGVRNEFAIRRSWKLLCQFAQQQANVDRIRQLEEALKQAEADAEQLRAKKVHFAVEAGKGEIVRQKIVNQYLPTFLCRLHQSTEYKRSLGQVFTLAVGKGFIDGISIGHKEEDIHAILKATPNVDPTSSETFITAYEKLFDQRYPYVDKVARMYLLDPTELQNIMTPDGGPRDTSTVSYA
nr:hypothetical protein [Tanacetum cinerariifolium]